MGAGLSNQLREPIPEIRDTERYLDTTVSAHQFKQRELQAFLPYI